MKKTMKRNNIIVCLFSGITLLTACHDLDLNPLSYGSTETWYSNEIEIEMAVNELYRDAFWPLDEEGNTDWSDDNIYRESLTPFQNATLNGQTDKVTDLWSKQYKVVSRANGVILKAHRAVEAGASESKINGFVAEAHFHRACAYAKLSSKFGDVPLVETDIDIEEGMAMGRTDIALVKQFVYDEFDTAAETLPVSYSGVQRATKGAALAMKARYALYMGDYEVVVESQAYSGFLDTVYNAVANGVGPNMIINYASTAADYVKDGLVVDLSKYVFDEEIGMADVYNSLPESIKAETVGFSDGGMYALPAVTTGPIFFINKTIYDELGLTAPTTWEELAENSKKIYEAKGVAGFAADSLTDMMQALMMLRSNKVRWTADPAAEKKEQCSAQRMEYSIEYN